MLQIVNRIEKDGPFDLKILSQKLEWSANTEGEDPIAQPDGLDEDNDRPLQSRKSATHDLHISFRRRSGTIHILQHIGKVRSQFNEDEGPQDKDRAGYHPEFEGPAGIFPEPDAGDEAVAVALGDVIDGIQLHQGLVLFRHHLDVPDDGGEPEAELDEHGHHLPHILHENDQGGRDPGQAHHQDDHGEEIVDHLEIAQPRLVAVSEKGEEDDGDKEEVDEERREDLDDRDHANLEDDLLHQVAVLQDGIRRVPQALREEEPGYDAGDQPENERVVVHRGHPEADIEDEPQQEDRDRRLHKGPEEVQVGAHVPRLDVPASQAEDEAPALKERDDEAQKENADVPDPVHARAGPPSFAIRSMQSARAACQGRTGMPKVSLILSLHRQELAGRRARVGYCSV